MCVCGLHTAPGVAPGPHCSRLSARAGCLTHTLPEIPAPRRLIRSPGLPTWDRLKGLALAVTISWTASKLQSWRDKRARAQALWAERLGRPWKGQGCLYSQGVRRPGYR